MSRSRPPAGAPTDPDPFVAALVTPEAVLLEFRPAGLASRMLARILDFIVQFVALWVVLLSLAITGGTGTVAVTLFAVFLIVFGYPAIAEAVWGRTMGKLALGLRVVTTEGGPARFRHTAIRSLLFVIDFWVPPGGLTGVVAILLTRRAQRLGDLAAGTLVVRARRGAEHTEPVWFAPPPGHEGFAAHLDVAGLQPRQYQLIRRFLLRTPELAPEVRWRLAQGLATGVAEAIGRPRPEGMHPESFLLCVAYAHQQRGAAPAGLAGIGPPPAPGPLAPPGPPSGVGTGSIPPPPSGTAARGPAGGPSDGAPLRPPAAPPPRGAPLQGPTAPPPPPGERRWGAPLPPGGPPRPDGGRR